MEPAHGGRSPRDEDHPPRPTPRLLASTVTADYQAHDDQSSTLPQLFRTAQFSADGTTLLTTTWDHSLSAYVLPQDLLDPDSPLHNLHPQGKATLQSPIRSLAPNPSFSLADPATQTSLVASIDRPIQLHHFFPHGASGASRIASYSLINDKTEAYIAPNCMLWHHPGSVFLCGSANRLDVFDVTREGQAGHLATLQTIPKEYRSARGAPVHGWKGTISALAASGDGEGGNVVAAGSWNRWVALYDYYRTPAPISHWCLADATDPLTGEGIPGGGIVQATWSPCGRYLVLNERNSEGLVVYDIRQGHRLLSVIGPRDARTQMRLGCDVFATDFEASGSGDFELWGGTVDGAVEVWEKAGYVDDGEKGSTWSWKAHDAPVTNTALHFSGSVVATTAGTWNAPSESVMESKLGRRDANGVPEMPAYGITSDTSLKIWGIGA